MNELFYPTIDLFIYDLRSPLNASADEITQNYQAFLTRLPSGLDFKNTEIETEYLELTTPTRIKLKPVDLRLEGYYYPVLLNDTYGLQIDCSVNNLTEPQSIDSFSSIATEIAKAAASKALTIGRTWTVSGWLTAAHPDPERIAIDCYQALFTTKETPEIRGKGTFLDAQIFEVWGSPSVASDRVLIILFPDRSTLEKAAEFYTDWIGLFCYSHKISWAYHQSRALKESLIYHYKKVEDNASKIQNSQNINVKLVDLQVLFNDVKKILNAYTSDLLNLSFQKQIININLVNYRNRLEQIKTKAVQSNDLEFLDRFGDLAEKKYLAQIDKDTENMQLGLKLLETNISALRSQIEIEKSERDLNFQNLVTLIGAGTAISTLFDYDGKKCKAVFSVSKEPEVPHICNNFWFGSVVMPIGTILLLGGVMLSLKCLWVEIKGRKIRPKD
ncbi:hypothetical protein [Chamaesiphon sp. OTE_75_metabat_556]|uniref:hypothetical protein n=1 Tax=Chamaesiphon sp. OTE_75_metabat_556 TaxID=2964692 RepID=UPI00286BF217|nr:hypothetical protein [Chamaesiphon sp. OTE_75_metabat_556]